MGTVEERLAGLEHDVNNLTGWQRTQNGAIHRVEEDVSELKETFRSEFSRLQYWFMGIMGSIIMLLVTVLVRT